jgi:oxygen-dependent protoporphyrinogen oxidase
VGGGVSGLAAAHRAVERARERGQPVGVTLLEAGDRLGGAVSTAAHDGFLVEAGPDSFITDKPWARFLAERLGLSGRLIGTNPEFRRSFVVRRGRLAPTPEGFQMLAPSRLRPLWRSPILSSLGKLRASLEPWVPRRAAGGDESVASFVRRRFGQELLERLAQPMAAGIYGADPEELSLEATFPRFLLMEKERGSVLRALRAAPGARGHTLESSPAESDREAPTAASGARYALFASFDRGMQTLTDALAARLPAGAAVPGVRVLGLGPAAGGAPGWTVRSARGEESADAVILALPAPDAARLLEPLDLDLAGDLGSIAYGSSVVVTLAYREGAIADPMRGAGFVVPAVEGAAVAACTFSHRKFAGRAPAGHALLRAYHTDRALALEDAELVAVTRAELDRWLGISAAPLFAEVARHARATPRYRVGHRELVTRIEARTARHRGLFLAGNAYRGVGIPDSVRSGEAAAESALALLDAASGRRS